MILLIFSSAFIVTRLSSMFCVTRVSPISQNLAALLNNLLNARFARITGVDDREHLLLQCVLQVFSFGPDVLCRSGPANDNSLEIGYCKHHFVEVLTDSFVVVVSDSFSDTFETSSRLSASAALAGYSRGEALDDLDPATFESCNHCLSPINHDYSIGILLDNESQERLNMETGITPVKPDCNGLWRSEHVNLHPLTAETILRDHTYKDH